MATVTGMTAEKINEIVDASIVSAAIDPATGVLTFETRGGQTITAGNVDLASKAIDKAYPIGSIFMTTIATSPADQLGVGTWTRWGQGRVPVSLDEFQTEFDTVEETGGEKTHAISTGELPAHSHSMSHTHSGSTASDGGHIHSQDSTYSTSDGTSWTTYRTGSSSGAVDTPSTGAHSHTFTTGGPSTGSTGSAGSGNPANNLQPYITCYMWKRTA